MGEHGGTHVDAPFHFNANGWTVDQIPPTNLIDVPAVIIDVSKSVNELERPHEFVLEVNHIETHEKSHETIPIGSVILINFGWSKFWPNKIKYLGWDNSTENGYTLNFPGDFFIVFSTFMNKLTLDNSSLFDTGISEDAATFLAKERKIIGIGLDTASVDPGFSKVSITNYE